MPDPTPKHVQSTENWLKTTACIARNETKYFRAEPFDLMNIGRVKDQEMSELGNVIENIAIFFCVGKRKVITKYAVVARGLTRVADIRQKPRSLDRQHRPLPTLHPPRRKSLNNNSGHHSTSSAYCGPQCRAGDARALCFYLRCGDAVCDLGCAG
jgi:hypothetical protein